MCTCVCANGLVRNHIVIEPRWDNHKMIRNLAKCGYANLKEFDFPHKRAMLGNSDDPYLKGFGEAVPQLGEAALRITQQ